MADLPPSAFTGVFHRPFAEQVAFFRAKLGKLVPTQFWTDLEKAAHDTGFMVAGAAKADLLQDLATAVDKAIAEGTSIEAFRKDFFDIVARHGWTNYTGSGTAAGRAWRTRVIYTTNAQTSYSAGRLAQLRAGNFKLWVYRHSDGEMYPRPVHESWDGLVLPPYHPFWKQHYPPSGWGCRCYVLGARGDVSARAMGGDPTKQLPEGWEQIDPKTGEQRGIDKGWGYMPGDTVSDAVNDMVAKTQQWDYTLAKAYMQDVAADTRDALATAYRDLPSTADDTRRYVQRVLSDTTTADVPPYRTLGLATSKQVARIGDMLPDHVNVSGFDFALAANDVRHTMSGHGLAAEMEPGQEPVSAADFALLPAILNDADAKWVYAGRAKRTGHPVLSIVARIAGQAFTARWEVLTGRRMLALKTFFKGTKP